MTLGYQQTNIIPVYVVKSEETTGVAVVWYQYTKEMMYYRGSINRTRNNEHDGHG